IRESLVRGVRVRIQPFPYVSFPLLFPTLFPLAPSFPSLPSPPFPISPYTHIPIPSPSPYPPTPNPSPHQPTPTPPPQKPQTNPFPATTPRRKRKINRLLLREEGLARFACRVAMGDIVHPFGLQDAACELLEEDIWLSVCVQMEIFRQCWQRFGNDKRTGSRDV
ncbi:hypothetical protein J1614_005874, partial [Plenodomus biglobosus]